MKPGDYIGFLQSYLPTVRGPRYAASAFANGSPSGFELSASGAAPRSNRSAVLSW